MFIVEPEKRVRILETADICVLGGSCTGVFAAVRAARLGARVVLIEKQNCFGGVATNGLVNVWHSLLDTNFQTQIIAGMTQELMERLKRRNAVREIPKRADFGFVFNSEELKIDLDEVVMESGVIAMLHTLYCAPYINNGELEGVFVENKSGRGVILAKVFIDATGDGDLCFQLGAGNYYNKAIQPPTACAKLYGLSECDRQRIAQLIMEHREEYNLEEDWGWRTFIPGVPEVTQNAELHVFGSDCSNASQLSYAEIESRRKIRAILDILRKYGDEESHVSLLALPSYIGIRETRHIACVHRLTRQELLMGRVCDDAIANGSYRIDIHHDDKPGITFQYLDGKQVYCRTGYQDQISRWGDDDCPAKTFWQVPYRCLIPKTIYPNVLLAGRMLDAEPAAFGAVRVMVSTNQMGEAAGTAAFLALDDGCGVADVNVPKLRKTLASGGSVVI